MKKTITLISFIMLIGLKANAQGCASGTPWCTGGIPIVGSDVLGGDGNTFNPLKITTVGINRIFIDGSGTGPGNGYVGIGNAFTAPVSRLHTTQGGNVTNWFQMTGNNTGATANDGLRIGVLNPISGPFDVQFRQQENAPMEFFQGDANPAAPTIFERIRITNGPGHDHTTGTLQNITKVMINHAGTGIGTFITPVSMFNIGEEIPAPGPGLTYGGYRPWMEVGTRW